MGVALTHPLPRVTHPVTCSPYVKYQPDLSLNLLLAAKTISCKCGYYKTTHTHTHVYTHTVTCSPYAKFYPDWSIDWLLATKTIYCVCVAIKKPHLLPHADA